MSHTLEDLRERGADEIHQKTHISIHSINAILEERYHDIGPIQYNGFLNIIESNLHMNLSDLRERYRQYREDTGQETDVRKLFVHAPQEVKKESKPLILGIVVGLLLILLIFAFISNDEDMAQDVTQTVTNPAIEDAKNSIVTDEANITEAQEEKLATFDPSQVEKEELASTKQPFVLYPKDELWIGIVNLDTGEKKDTITKDPFPLDENAHLLISLGHGYVKVELYDKIEDLSDKGRVRYHYKNGELDRISLSKFKELNKGESW